MHSNENYRKKSIYIKGNKKNNNKKKPTKTLMSYYDIQY